MLMPLLTNYWCLINRTVNTIHVLQSSCGYFKRVSYRETSVFKCLWTTVEKEPVVRLVGCSFTGYECLWYRERVASHIKGREVVSRIVSMVESWGRVRLFSVQRSFTNRHKTHSVRTRTFIPWPYTQSSLPLSMTASYYLSSLSPQTKERHKKWQTFKGSAHI